MLICNVFSITFSNRYCIMLRYRRISGELEGIWQEAIVAKGHWAGVSPE